MTRYKMLRDTPHGKAGSVWEKIEENPNEWIALRPQWIDKGYLFKYGVSFPYSTFSEYFEEIEEMKKFTKKQNESIREKITNLRIVQQMHATQIYELTKWLDENTEV